MSDMNVYNWFLNTVIERFEQMQEETAEDKRNKVAYYEEITNVDTLKSVCGDILGDMVSNQYSFVCAVYNSLDYWKMRREIEDHLTDDVRELEIDLQGE